MFEPIYQNTSESTTDASGVVMDERQLLAAVSDCQRTFRRGDPEKDLKDKYRYNNVIIKINNNNYRICYKCSGILPGSVLLISMSLGHDMHSYTCAAQDILINYVASEV